MTTLLASVRLGSSYSHLRPGFIFIFFDPPPPKV
jgi:hypothetical protein